jgi:hypothetical protein
MRELTERGRELPWDEQNRRTLRKLCLPCMRKYPDRCRACLRDTLQYRLITTAIKARKQFTLVLEQLHATRNPIRE